MFQWLFTCDSRQESSHLILLVFNIKLGVRKETPWQTQKATDIYAAKWNNFALLSLIAVVPISNHFNHFFSFMSYTRPWEFKYIMVTSNIWVHVLNHSLPEQSIWPPQLPRGGISSITITNVWPFRVVDSSVKLSSDILLTPQFPRMKDVISNW